MVLYLSSLVVFVLTRTVVGTNLTDFPPISKHAFKPDTMMFDKIYIVHLKRRTERRQRMEKAADAMKLDFTYFHAVDGRNLNTEKLDKLGVQILQGYSDIYQNRNMTYGEIGCALTHYYILEDMVVKNYQRVLILEDDAQFVPMFRKQLSRSFADIEEFVPDWDLLFLGRKPMNATADKYVDGTHFAMWPDFSYWALAYAITRKGAKKILKQKPLQKLVPTDELIPIMYNRHPMEEWKKLFYPNDLKAVATNPLLIYPSWWFGETKYISDTEDSRKIASTLET
ncbi:glycosyltransferase 25 family member-like [Mytilus edulis]|uniref:glycosyltransferase 25 family member-like n=1 Tax=Mytilus edulis TaxID=6550 RepID=UPI0039F0820C